MTVKELIELNNFIGDITITVRGGIGGGVRLKEIHIGHEEGAPHLYSDDKDVYEHIDINTQDMGEGYYRILVSKIPKQYLGLTVTSFWVWNAHRGLGIEHELEHILINVKPDGYAEEVDKAAKEKEIDVDGQMNFADFPEVLP